MGEHVEYRYLGRSGLQVSVVGLGGNNFGRRVDEERTIAVVNRALELGINFFDTSDSYGPRTSEEYLGRALKGHRREVVLTTKFGSRLGRGPHWSGGSRRYIVDALHDSLRRLGTDYVDLYQMHVPDRQTPIEETLRALDDLVRSGEVRYVGHSNFSAAQAVEAAWVAKTEHLAPFISAQNLYNLLESDVRGEFTRMCQRYGLGIIPWGPLAGGFLTGKYQPGQPPPQGTRLAGAPGTEGPYRFTEQNFATLQKLEAIAEGAGRSMLELSLSWLAQQPCVASIIAGATRPEQLDENVNAVSWKLSSDELAAVHAATKQG
jgi:aryl-alcohol dehydrogenase-like predicted oxidoreductase